MASQRTAVAFYRRKKPIGNLHLWHWAADCRCPQQGMPQVLDAIGFDSIIKDADLIITGEGKIDSQTLTGKTPYGVLQRAKLQGIPVVAIGGSVQLDSEDATRVGFAAVLQVTPPGMPLHDAMNPETASENIYRTVLRLIQSA